MQKNTTQKAPIFFLIGLMGSGKTYWGQALAKKNNFSFIDLDAAIEHNEKLFIPEIFSKHGEAFFRNVESQTLRQVLNSDSTIIATGGGTPCFLNNMQLMNESGITIWLNLSIENIVKKIVPEKERRPLIADISNEHLSAFFASQLRERKFFYQQSNHCLSGNEISENNLQKIIDLYV